MRKLYFNTLAFVLFLSFSLSAQTIRAERDTYFTGVVESIYDGDTIRVLFPDRPKSVSIRFKGVDTPEIEFHGESQGEAADQAREALESWIGVGSEVQILVQAGDPLNHSRLLGFVIYQGEDINLKLLKEGWAFPYLLVPFAEDFQESYTKASKEAFDLRKGLFSQDNQEKLEALELMEPYLFRLERQGKTGHYFTGDYRTKKLFGPKETRSVPFYNRIFFHSLEAATKSGYSL